MMPVVTSVFSVIILTSSVTIAQSKGINSGDKENWDVLSVVIGESDVTNSNDNVIISEEVTSSKDDLIENKSEISLGVDIVDNENEKDVDIDSEKKQIDLDGNVTLDEEATDQVVQLRKSQDGGEDVDEELQQDLPDVWSDTGQFLAGILENPIRLEEAPSSSLGIMIGAPSEEEAVECPPPVVLVTPSLCGAPACLTHRHCRDPETACCFNGCVHTCLRPLDAPAVIDWLEDTSLILPMLDEAPGVPRYPMLFEGSSSIAYAQGGGEAVHLQGGCTITSQQYDQLKDYMARTNIQDCSCTGGEVVCVVKPYKREEEE